ncbi:MAG: branched-chain amino acid ABC transporter permease [Spirochaetaceae bacterium]|jgi:branched-chain amino acid transport system permease protein|nr:branched-chain amino acid ABC transporter permease [Spirochaetaceae bacterium]
MEYFLTQLINGLAIGSIYALLSVGYSIIYSILQLINFAHGDLCAVGVFICFTVLTLTGNVFLALIAACLFGALLGFAVERFAYRPVRTASRAAPFVSAVGASLIMRGGAQLLWGSKTMPFPAFIPFKIFPVGGGTVNGLSVNIFAVAVLLMILVTLFVQKTKAGLAVRCVAQNIQVASLMGIPVNQVIALVYASGAVVGVLGEIFFAAYYNSIFIGMGFLGTIKAFTACLLGGLGNLYGAFFGGIILGLVEALGAGFVSSGFRDALAYGVLILVLVIKPTGLFGMKVSEKV